MVTGELYPSGPACLPCPVQIAGEVFTAGYVPAVKIAHHVASAQWGMLAADLFAADSNRIRERAMNPDDVLDIPDVTNASVMLTIRLSGLGEGIMGWRALMHMSGYMVREWRSVSGHLIADGVDPTTDQYWRVMSAVYHLVTARASANDREWVERLLEYPLPIEPLCIPDAGSTSAVRRRSARAFDSMAREL